MTLETSPWDSAELLDSPEDIAAYIEAAFEAGDPSIITHALGVVARAKGMSQVARESDRSREARSIRLLRPMATRSFPPS